MPKATRKAPTRALSCHACGSALVKVSESQQFVRRDGRRRLAADVRCTQCKHRWWSVHWAALLIARAKDAAAGA